MRNTFVNILKIPLLKWFVLGILVLSIAIYLRGNTAESQQVYVAGQHDVEQVVLLSGDVRAVGQVDLSFDASGKVATTTVSQGDVVQAGDILAELDYGTLEADLLQAQGYLQSMQSNVSLARASVQKAEANLELVSAQNRGTDSSVESAEIALENTVVEQNTLVQNAYLDLLNNDLTAYPVDNHQNVPAPTVSGSYTGDTSGEYILDFYNSGGSTGYSVHVSGLSGNTVSFDDYGIPSVLSIDGLYLTLPESGEGSTYGNTDWIIPVPNTRSATYQAKLGAYEKAQQTQTLAVSKAQANLDVLSAQQANGDAVAITTAQQQQASASLQEAEANLSQVYGALTQANAGIAKVRAQINNSIIFAPFDGTIARLDFEVGQSVTPGYVGITVVTDGNYELVMSIPEIDVAKVNVGDTAEIILDAYASDVVWSGVLAEVDLVETEVDGVPVYSSVVTISNADDRIKIGMNARAKIVIAQKNDVLAIPASYIISNGDTSTILVKVNERQTEERIVTTGLVGTDYFVEITSGLNADEILIAPVKE